MKTWKNIVLASLIASTLGCGDSDGGGFSLGSTDPGDISSGVTAPSSSPLYLVVTSTLDDTTETVVRTTDCHIPAGTAAGNPGTGLPATAYGSCSVSIPELTLWHSKLKFYVGTTSVATCGRVTFYPFYYTRSVTNLSQIDGSSALACSTTPRDKYCYGGAAPWIVENFPSNTGMFHIPLASLEKSYELISAEARRASDKSHSIWQTNADTANSGLSAMTVDLPDGTFPGVDMSYLDAGDTNPDYLAVCEDAWGTAIYSLTLTIRDEDYTSGGYTVDHFWDWANP